MCLPSLKHNLTKVILSILFLILLFNKGIANSIETDYSSSEVISLPDENGTQEFNLIEYTFEEAEPESEEDPSVHLKPLRTSECNSGNTAVNQNLENSPSPSKNRFYIIYCCLKVYP
ncbi:hypothetical protein GWK08_09160 [Leptobacterium flavescens]|uniref:Uncharacterized protein n=1 Tax=Leptobacterium flavescens TaxID=472055 RepID=A0A6P0UK51_9FLAO|nr:hypothetical protein [Leptobacterium flavescens]NER13604.1 hypothetical protein [Leptobacterium flavescens]